MPDEPIEDRSAKTLTGLYGRPQLLPIDLSIARDPEVVAAIVDVTGPVIVAVAAHDEIEGRRQGVGDDLQSVAQVLDDRLTDSASIADADGQNPKRDPQVTRPVPDDRDGDDSELARGCGCSCSGPGLPVVTSAC